MSEDVLRLTNALGSLEAAAITNDVVRNIAVQIVPDLGNPLDLWVPLGAATAVRPQVFLHEAGREMSDIINASHLVIRRYVLRAGELEKAIEEARALAGKCIAKFGSEERCRDALDRLNQLVQEYNELDGDARRDLGVSVRLISDKESLVSLIDMTTRVTIKNRLAKLAIATSDLPYHVIGAQPLPATPTQPPQPQQQAQPQQAQQQQRPRSLLDLFRGGVPRR